MTTILKSRSLVLIVGFLFISFASISQTNSAKTSDLIEEVRKMEKQFETDLNKMGAAFAFEKYAAPNAVVKRQNDTLIYGPKAIGLYYANDIYKNAKANWAPDYIEVSKDGTMAYTYGRYQWKMVGKSGEALEYKGIFHTVWVRQPDGTWKYAWD